MKKIIVYTLLLTLLLVGCTSASETAVDTPVLTVGDGENQKGYTTTDLQALSPAEASFKDVTYIGVPVTTLLADSGFAAEDLKAVKAIAADGYSVNYDLAQIQKADVIVSYAQADGPLTSEDGDFRMVMPAEEGKMNVRMLVEIQVVP